MNNELFDRIMKENLNKVQVTPSAGLKKSIGRKLFFQNLMTFHKVKVIIAALLIGTSGVAGYTYLNSNGNSNSIYTSQTDESIERNREFGNKLIHGHSSAIANNTAQEGSNSLQNQLIEEKVINSKTSKVNNNISNSKSIANNQGNYVTKQVSNDDKNTSTEEPALVEDMVSFPVEKTSKSSDSSNDAKEITILSNNKENRFAAEAVHEELYLAHAKQLDLGADYLSIPVSVKEEDISFKNKPMIRKEISIDVYKGLMSTNDIDNSLKSEDHQEFYWDFYKENEALTTSSLGGFDVNYAIGTKTLKGKVSLGLNASQVSEQKAIYEFDEVTDPQWLEFFNVDDLAWVKS